jgi:vacuolar protein 8
VELLRDGSDEGRAEASGALWFLGLGNDTNQAAIVEAGGIPPLIELLRGGSDKGRAEAAYALGSLSINVDIQATMVAAGVIPLLVNLLRSGSDKGRVEASCVFLRSVAIPTGQLL